MFLVATNLCFDMDDGQFNSRSDLVDAATCALARGSQVLGVGRFFWLDDTSQINTAKSLRSIHLLFVLIQYHKFENKFVFCLGRFIINLFFNL